VFFVLVFISGMTNLLMGTELTAQQLEYVKVAQASGNSLMYMFLL
jgi:histidine kinase 2/3/4 (cytokinin receptor)